MSEVTDHKFSFLFFPTGVLQSMLLLLAVLSIIYISVLTSQFSKKIKKTRKIEKVFPDYIYHQTV